MEHKIKRQVIDLKVCSGLDAFSIQHKMSEHFSREIIPLMENEFDKATGSDDYIVIERLEVDLGSITLAQVNNDSLSAGVLVKIKQSLSESFNAYSAGSYDGDVKRTWGENCFKQWLFYMQKGCLPWNTKNPDSEWYYSVIETLATDYKCITELRTWIKKSERLLNRIIKQHSQDIIVKLAEVLTANRQADLPDIENEFVLLYSFIRNRLSAGFKEQAFRKSIKENELREVIRKKIISFSAEQGGSRTTKDIVNYLVSELLQDVSLALVKDFDRKGPKQKHVFPELKRIKKEFHGQNEKKNMAEESLKVKDKEKEKNTRSNSDKSRDGKLPNEIDPAGHNKIIDHEESNAGLVEKPVSYRNEKNANSMYDTKSPEADGGAVIVSQKIDDDGIFTDHAGLLLLHPFIHSFFRLTGITKGTEFVNKQQQERALYLLHYAASGRSNAEEYELVIPKILCGYEIEQPVNSMIEITLEEKQQADDMLRAAIAKWSILKATTPDGLRQGFLSRNGKVTSKNGNLYILVEKSSIDVLLDYLPWNLSIIKIPWLKELIRVEWR